MEPSSLIIQITKVIAWPIAVVIIVIILRVTLGHAIMALSRLRYKGLELEFGKNLKDVEDKVGELGLPPPEDVRTIPDLTVPSKPYDSLFQLARSYPRAAITEAWRSVEGSLRQIAEVSGIALKGTPKGPRANRELIHRLTDDAKLHKGTLDLYESLRVLRNSAVHSFESEIDVDEAMRYVDLALSLVAQLQTLLNK